MSLRPKILGCVLAFVTAFGSARAAGQNDGSPQPKADDQPVSSEPRQTSAAFGDWVVRCDRPSDAGGKRVCEAAQSLVVKGQQSPIAQIAFGHTASDKGMDPAVTLTVLLPTNVSFAQSPRLGTGSGSDNGLVATLVYRRCVPGGCLADAKPDGSILKAFRGAAQKPGHLTFTDAAERTLTLPVSFRGLPQAFDDLAKETGPSGGNGEMTR